MWGGGKRGIREAASGKQIISPNVFLYLWVFLCLCLLCLSPPCMSGCPHICISCVSAAPVSRLPMSLGLPVFPHLCISHVSESPHLLMSVSCVSASPYVSGSPCISASLISSLYMCMLEPPVWQAAGHDIPSSLGASPWEELAPSFHVFPPYSQEQLPDPLECLWCPPCTPHLDQEPTWLSPPVALT